MGEQPDWTSVWADTAKAVRDHVDAGRRHLLTEDTVRFAAALVLEQRGVAPGRVAFEVPDPSGSKGRIDLVVDADGPDATAVEFKFPRGARSAISPDTMTLGELLHDFYRTAALPWPRRFLVQVLDDRIAGYLDRLAARLPLRWTTEPGTALLLEPSTVGRLPVTARNQVAGWFPHTTVKARCTARHDAGSLDLVVYELDPPGATA